MALGLPENSKQVENRIKTDVQRSAPDSRPFVRVNWIGAMLTAVGRRIFDFYQDLQGSINNLFPNTASGSFLNRWSAIFVGSRNAASNSSGNLVATGTLGNSVPINQLFSSGPTIYQAQAAGEVLARSFTILSIERTANIARATTSIPHGMASNVPVSVSGAGQAEYNVTDTAINVTGLSTFEYVVQGSPITPATGTITASAEFAIIPVQSTTTGGNTNLNANAVASLQSPISGIDGEARVDFGAIGGGSDTEGDASYRSRTLEHIQDPVAHFSRSEIIQRARAVPGVTRVFVQESGSVIDTVRVTSITRSGNVATARTASAHNLSSGQSVTIRGATQGQYNASEARVIVEDSTTFHYVVFGSPQTPATGVMSSTGVIPLGQVQVYFVRDDDTNLIPDASEVATVKAAIDAIRPANTGSEDVIVSAPVARPIDFNFSFLSPNTDNIRSAIMANLEQFLRESVSVGVTIDEDSYRSVIKNTVDASTNQEVIDFALRNPNGDIQIEVNELPTLGTVQF